MRSSSADRLWALVIAVWLLSWLLVDQPGPDRRADRAAALVMKVLVPALFGAWLLFLWEVIVRGMGVPPVLLPPPSAIWARIITSLPTLWEDFRQTFLKAVLAGYAIGCGSGFLVAILVDRVAVPASAGCCRSAISSRRCRSSASRRSWSCGSASTGRRRPRSSSIMTFFPMLVNTVAGLAAAEHMERDLMRTYAAGYWQTLFKLRLPAALAVHLQRA